MQISCTRLSCARCRGKPAIFPGKLHWWTCCRSSLRLGSGGVNVGKPHSRTSQLDSIKRHLKITKDVIEGFFMLEVPLTQYLRLKTCSVIVITASFPACTSFPGILRSCKVISTKSMSAPGKLRS